MDGKGRVRNRRGYAFVEELKGFFLAELQGMGIEGAQAEKISGALAKVLSREYGGFQPYIPLLPGSLREDEWEAALEKYSRGGLSVEGLARKMVVGKRAAYLRVNGYLGKRLPKAPSSPDTAMVAPPAGLEPKQAKY